MAKKLLLFKDLKKIIKEEASDDADEGEFGGKGPFELPEEHLAGMPVPKGGSSCANCMFLKMVGKQPHCMNELFKQWNGGSRIPTDDPESYCSDWYSTEK